MSNEHTTHEPNLIGRRQALCTFAGIATAIAGVGILGIGTAHAGQAPEQAIAKGETVTAEQAVAASERLGEAEREAAMVAALIPADLDMGKWTLERVHGTKLGAIAVVMRTHSGEAFQLDILARDPGVSGVGESEHFSVFVANNGDGSHSTDELQARGAKVLAHHLSRTERSGAPLPQLLTFRQRAAQHPLGQYGVLG
ncbi:hypothetical protein G6O69_04030 [Pseudenhygromyxa sp. WMMC2535]|uniref:hypothetical protein n=1 Tax=Pseudenhygromyxa sp. WMMC2535 TaxID=2712867 RepID=UPI0015544EB8|nr:hypothetical protein [Pseudenhygromyxa sp. WMMC2535]NVB36985.1 hypothetical protein [Pseudenhygromyxa sp. WMMC2535]